MLMLSPRQCHIVGTPHSGELPPSSVCPGGKLSERNRACRLLTSKVYFSSCIMPNVLEADDKAPWEDTSDTCNVLEGLTRVPG